MWELGQVIATMVLSVVVRCGPVRTAVNGTLVARPGSMRAAQKATPARSAMVQGWATRPYALTGWPWRMPGPGRSETRSRAEIMAMPGENRPAMGAACRLKGPCGM
jgi:hypothetical protein